MPAAPQTRSGQRGRVRVAIPDRTGTATAGMPQGRLAPPTRQGHSQSTDAPASTIRSQSCTVASSEGSSRT
eukprot:scaffold24983_cov107-Isochrysis_galbana.AAC.4